jgi:hypothetical protein
MATRQRRAKSSESKLTTIITPALASEDTLSMEDRVARGKAARVAHPREALSELRLSPNRPDPVAILEKQAETRLQALLPIR